MFQQSRSPGLPIVDMVDYDNGVAIVQKDSSGEFEIDVDPTDLKFQNSKVRMLYRQTGGWVEQTALR